MRGGTEAAHTALLTTGHAALWCLLACKSVCELAYALQQHVLMHAPRGRVVDLAADQDTTDLQKCLACASRMIAADPGRYGDAHILAIGALAPVAVHLRFFTPRDAHTPLLQTTLRLV